MSINSENAGGAEPTIATGGAVTVRYWAGARAAAGVATDDIVVEAEVTLTELRSLAVALHPGTRLAEVLAVCAVLVGDLPVSSVDPGTVVIVPGSTVEFLPPFAGG